MRFATFLKFVKKNCQRARDKFLYYESNNLTGYGQEIYIVRKCLDEQLTPYGIIGSFSQLNFIIQTNLNKKALKRLGKAALRKGKFLFLKDVINWYLKCRCLTGTPNGVNEDMREIPFRELDIEKYRSLKYNRYSMGLTYITDPF